MCKLTVRKGSKLSDIIEDIFILEKVPQEPPLPPVPEHVKELQSTMQVLTKAWEMHEKTLLLTDNDRAAADRAFEAVRGRRPIKK